MDRHHAVRIAGAEIQVPGPDRVGHRQNPRRSRPRTQPDPSFEPAHQAHVVLDEVQRGHKGHPQPRGGERRRVEIARALATEPGFILLDEPFAGVDPISVLDIQSIIRHLKERDIGVLITDHNVRETLGICERAYIMNAGEVIAQGKPDKLLETEQVRKVYLGEDFKL